MGTRSDWIVEGVDMEVVNTGGAIMEVGTTCNRMPASRSRN